MKHTKYNFCTLFDSNYLTKGLILYDSLIKTCDHFHLYVYAFDDFCYKTLLDLKLPHLTVVSLLDFENEDLLKIKPTRTIAEYCWTCSPSIIWHAIHHFDLDHCTYIDADLLFFNSPKIAYDEISEASIAITEHFMPEDDLAGRFCVQFVYINNDENGLKALKWWKDSCIEWCFARYEDGKFGDQKYLDLFPILFEKVHIFKHRGVGVAPWNMAEYNYLSENMLEFDGQTYPVVFFHYHGIAIKYDEVKLSLKLIPTTFDLQKNTKEVFYIPFLLAYKKVRQVYFEESILSIAVEQRKNYKRWFAIFKKMFRRNKVIRFFYYRFIDVKNRRIKTN